MNETCISRNNGRIVREDGQGSVRAGCGERDGDGVRNFAVCIGNGQLGQIFCKGGVVGALDCMHDQKAVVTNGKPPRKYIVRRLTPTECARLQGFPDWWCEGLGGSDSAIYKAYGNGLALPCAYDVLRRIAKEHDQTTL